MDIFERIKNNPGPLGQFAAYGDGYFIFPKLEGEIGPVMRFDGKEMIVWSINDYLGLANNPEVREADTEGTKKWGLAYPMGARAMSGQTTLHEQLEKEVAEFAQKPAAYVLNFGYQGIMSAIDSLVSKNDVIVYDVDSHASIVDGVRMHLGKRFTYKHNDIESLVKNLERAKAITDETGGGILVITEGVFGMRGEQGKLKEIVDLKEKYSFRLLVDDAHGFGTLGKTGAGTGEEQGVQNGIDIYFSTFAKSMASIGGFLAGDKDIIRYLRYNMRSQIFAKSLPISFVYGALKRLEIIRTQPQLKEKLWENVCSLQSKLKAEGFDIGNTNTCVTPVYLSGSPMEGTLIVRELRDTYNIFTSIVIYPVIPKGMLLLRLIPTARHTEQEINTTITAFKEIRQKLEKGTYQEIIEKLGLKF